MKKGDIVNVRIKRRGLGFFFPRYFVTPLSVAELAETAPTTIAIREQLDKVIEEVREIEAEADGVCDLDALAIETIDAIHAAEGLLTILDVAGVDVPTAVREVWKKNLDRGYYGGDSTIA